MDWRGKEVVEENILARSGNKAMPRQGYQF
jgi:hypothetical protein